MVRVVASVHATRPACISRKQHCLILLGHVMPHCAPEVCSNLDHPSWGPPSAMALQLRAAAPRPRLAVRATPAVSTGRAQPLEFPSRLGAVGAVVLGTALGAFGQYRARLARTRVCRYARPKRSGAPLKRFHYLHNVCVCVCTFISVYLSIQLSIYVSLDYSTHLYVASCSQASARA